MTQSYSVGIVNYRTYDELARCLESLRDQTLRPDATVVVDVDASVRPAELGRGLDIHFVETHNRGFAGGANLALETLSNKTDSTFLLLLNPDVRLDPDFAERLLGELKSRPRVALATGKLLRPDGSIDSAGILLPRHRRPRDRGSEEADSGQYDSVEFVFGASGAAMMIRREALAELALDGEVFDEDFFLYHEDTDLCWRAQLLGWQVLYVPHARAFHERNWRRERRFDIEVGVRRHSFKNHYLQLIKNEQPRDFWLNLPWLACWEILRLGFALLRDPEILRGYRDAGRLAGRAWRKRRLLRSATRERIGGEGRVAAAASTRVEHEAPVTPQLGEPAA